MMLIELSTVASGVLPLAEFREHLRLGSGFADDNLQDSVLETCLRAALAAIEARIGKAVLKRRFSWTLTSWATGSVQSLPVAPVVALESVALENMDGAATLVDLNTLRLLPAVDRPKLVAKTGSLPFIPSNGQAILVFEAGFGDDWTEVPSDVAQACMMVAAKFYEDRDANESGSALPQSVMDLIGKYRPMRLGRA